MVAKIDMTGRRVGRISVLGPSKSRNGRAMWRCRCDCGKAYLADGGNLRRPTTKSCGCHTHEELGERRFIDRTGQTFGRLKVTRQAPSGQRGVVWHCRCECGQLKDVPSLDLGAGRTRSCGCLLVETRGKANRTHGASGTPEHNVWNGMKQRGLNASSPDYDRYGGRGITVCKRWRDSFEAFLMDMGPRPPGTSIDRIDNSRGYSKRNCRWATGVQQARNKRNNRRLLFNGETRLLVEWCEIQNLKPATVVQRLNRYGWPVDEALSTRPRGRKG